MFNPFIFRCFVNFVESFKDFRQFLPSGRSPFSWARRCRMVLGLFSFFTFDTSVFECAIFDWILYTEFEWILKWISFNFQFLKRESITTLKFSNATSNSIFSTIWIKNHVFMFLQVSEDYRTLTPNSFETQLPQKFMLKPFLIVF